MMEQLGSIFSFLVVCSVFFGIPTLIYVEGTRWRQLTARYRVGRDDARVIATPEVPVPVFYWVPSRFINTQLGVTVRFYSAGLWIRPGMPLNFVMPSILVPWEEIEVVGQTESKIWPRVEFRVEGYRGNISISGPTAHELKEWLQRR